MYRAPLTTDVALAPRQAAPVVRRRRRVPWRLVRWAVIAAVWGAVGLGVMLVWFARDLPKPEDALDAVRRPSLVLQDDRGRTVATYGDLVGDPLRLSQLPKYLPEAAVAVEDRRFWSHWGLDVRGMLRAAVVDVFRGHIAQGGSTITQQVAKNLFLTNARTFRRKIQEVMLTLWLERHFTKAEILEIWLNRVYLGSGAWGWMRRRGCISGCRQRRFRCGRRRFWRGCRGRRRASIRGPTRRRRRRGRMRCLARWSMPG